MYVRLSMCLNSWSFLASGLIPCRQHATIRCWKREIGYGRINALYAHLLVFAKAIPWLMCEITLCYAHVSEDLYIWPYIYNRRLLIANGAVLVGRTITTTIIMKTV